MKIIKDSDYQAKLIEFLTLAIPGLDKISTVARTKVSN